MKNLFYPARIIQLSLVGLLVVTAGGCGGITYIAKPGFSYHNNYIEPEPIDMIVQLHLSDDFQTKTVKGATIGTFFGRNRDTVQFGPALVNNSTEMAHMLFREVLVSRGNRLEVLDGVDATLEPRFENFLQNGIRSNAFMQVCETVALSWVLKDRQGVTIWSDTISGTSDMTNLGMAHEISARTRRRIQQALDQTFTNAGRAISKSRKIRQFAESIGKTDKGKKD
ncbi:MAG: hypothetical protein KKC46_20140 [Proteobacteria bacterium]|nr:hypothetical protein [Pseudomonadota bacterium]